MTDVSTRYRPSRPRRSLREIFARAVRHHRIESRSVPRTTARPEKARGGER